LHKVRYGKYPDSLSDLKFTGEWDQIALQSVSSPTQPRSTLMLICRPVSIRVIKAQWTGPF
jgi:hypothetical protein